MVKNFLTLGRRTPRLLMVCALSLLSACATTSSPEQAIEQRAMGRWEALLSGDGARAYEYLSPGFRSSVSAKQYQKSLLLKKVQWNDARYIEGDCEETTCKVKISLDYTLYGALPGVKTFKGTQPVEESWVLVGQTWYLVPKK